MTLGQPHSLGRLQLMHTHKDQSASPATGSQHRPNHTAISQGEVKASLAFHRNGSWRYYLKMLSLKKIFELRITCCAKLEWWRALIISFSPFWFHSKVWKIPVALSSNSLFSLIPKLSSRSQKQFQCYTYSFYLPTHYLRTTWIRIISCSWELHAKWSKAMVHGNVKLIEF